MAQYMEEKLAVGFLRLRNTQGDIKLKKSLKYIFF